MGMFALIITEPFTTIIFAVTTCVLILLHILLFTDKKKVKKAKLNTWFDKIFGQTSEYYCINVKQEQGGYMLTVLYSELYGKNNHEKFIKTQKEYEEVCTDIINQLMIYINNGKNKEAMINALKIELSCEEEIFIIKEDVKWKEEAEF